MKWIALFTLLFTALQADECCEEKEELYLSFNIANGSKLELSDKTTYEIAPEDRIYSAYWITPFPIQLGESGDPLFPVKITNMATNQYVKGRKIDTERAVEENLRKQFAPKPQETKP